jgi:hypothetical protein
MNSKGSAIEYEFPHTYRTDTRTRHIVNFLIAALAGLIPFLDVLHWTQVLPQRGSLSADFLAELVTVAALVLPLGSMYNKRVVLHEDSIEVIGWFYSRKLSFAEIRGRQTTASSRGRRGYAHILFSTDKSKRKLVLPIYLHTDELFRNWLKTIPLIPRRQNNG